jgi:hypothetical protein
MTKKKFRAVKTRKHFSAMKALGMVQVGRSWRSQSSLDKEKERAEKAAELRRISAEANRFYVNQRRGV